MNNSNIYFITLINKNKMKKYIIYFLVFCIPFVAFSQTESSQDEAKSNWDFDIIPYVNFVSLDGSLTAMGQDIPFTMSFSDLFDQLSFAFSIHTEARNDRWGIMFDFLYIKLKEEGEIPDLMAVIETEIKQTMIEIGGAYQLNNPSGTNNRFEALLGLRYMDMSVNLASMDMSILDKGFNFTDPFVGVRWQNRWNKWALTSRFDIGGFGIGSEFSYKFNVLGGYNFSDLFSLYLGYQGLDIDYEQDNGFAYDVYTGGPILGFRFAL